MTDTEIQEIRGKIDIVKLVEWHARLQKRGDNYVAKCVFCDDPGKSFCVSPSRQIFHCFRCGAGGNAFTFVMKKTGLPFKDAVWCMDELAHLRGDIQE